MMSCTRFLAAGALVASTGLAHAAEDEATEVKVAVPLAEVRAFPEAFRRVPFDLALLYHGPRDVYNPFFTIFEPSSYLNFAAWSADAPIFTRDGFCDDYPFFYVDRKNSVLQRQVVAMRPLTWFNARCVVRDVAPSKAWIEVLSITVVGPLMDQTDLRHLVRANVLAGNGEFERALLEFDMARLLGAPPRFIARCRGEEGRVALAANQPERAAMALEQAFQWFPEDSQVATLLDRASTQIVAERDRRSTIGTMRASNARKRDPVAPAPKRMPPPVAPTPPTEAPVETPATGDGEPVVDETTEPTEETVDETAGEEAVDEAGEETIDETGADEAGTDESLSDEETLGDEATDESWDDESVEDETLGDEEVGDGMDEEVVDETGLEDEEVVGEEVEPAEGEEVDGEETGETEDVEATDEQIVGEEEVDATGDETDEIDGEPVESEEPSEDDGTETDGAETDDGTETDGTETDDGSETEEGSESDEEVPADDELPVDDEEYEDEGYDETEGEEEETGPVDDPETEVDESLPPDDSTDDETTPPDDPGDER